MIVFIKKMTNKRGQAIVELTLILPMILTLTLGAVELSNMIYTYQVMHHLTAQGANMAARLAEQPPSDPPLTFQQQVKKLMDTVIDASCPTIRRPSAAPLNCSSPNDTKWKVIFTRIGPDTVDPTQYVVLDQQLDGLGSIDDAKRICSDCGLGPITNCTASCTKPTNLPNLAAMSPGQIFFAFEIFYDYSPITVLGNFVGATFASKLYERSIF